MSVFTEQPPEGLDQEVKDYLQRLTDAVNNLDKAHGPWFIVGAEDASKFVNGWENYGISNWEVLKYRKRADGDIDVVGLVKSGSLGFITYLPEWARPPKKQMFTSVQGDNTVVRIDVNPDGGIYSHYNNNAYLSVTLKISI